MKTIIIMLTMAIASSSYAQKLNEGKVPEEVLSAFMAKFPDAQKVKWEMENNREWEAGFRLKGKKYSANFSADGNWTETEYEIEQADLPANILALLDQNFSGYELEKAEIAESGSGSSYELEIEVGEKEYEVVIDPKGKLTCEKKIEENDKD